MSLQLLRLIKNQIILKNIILQKRYAATNVIYDIPEQYRNSFYLANASFFDNINWYLHRAYEDVFPHLVSNLMSIEPSYSESQAATTIINIINSMDRCNELLDINFTIRKKNDQVHVLRGYRAHHGLAFLNKPCLGGI